MNALLSCFVTTKRLELASGKTELKTVSFTESLIFCIVPYDAAVPVHMKINTKSKRTSFAGKLKVFLTPSLSVFPNLSPSCFASSTLSFPLPVSFCFLLGETLISLSPAIFS